jgi:AraC family transcriptional regulator
MRPDAIAVSPSRRKDTLGCQSNKLLRDVQYDGGDVTFFRKTIDHEHLDRVTMPASERGFLIGISLNGGHKRNIFRGKRTITKHFDADSIYIRDFSEDYHADLYGNFDFVLAELSPTFLRRLGDEAGGRDIAGLSCSLNQKDPVLGHLAHAMADSLEVSGPLGALFIEQMTLAMGTHLVRSYGSVRTAETRTRGGLSAAHEARAKELLLQRSHARASIAEVASECNLSRGYFIRAFSRATGRTPHQWLLEQRVAEARELLQRGDTPLSEIAITCGFADQSHLNRVFLRVVGTSPGAWRRNTGR